MKKRLGYSPKVRERAVCLVLTSEHEHTASNTRVRSFMGFDAANK